MLSIHEAILDFDFDVKRNDFMNLRRQARNCRLFFTKRPETSCDPLQVFVFHKPTHGLRTVSSLVTPKLF